MPKLKEFFFGKSPSTKQLPTMSPQQTELQNAVLRLLSAKGGVGQGMQQGLEYFQDLLDPNSQFYQDMSAPYLREFQEQTVPGLAERFAGAGALSSSGFGQALSSAGAGLQEKLAALRAMSQQGAAQNLLSQFSNLYSSSMAQSPFAYQEKPGSTGFLPMAAAGILKGFFG